MSALRSFLASIGVALASIGLFFVIAPETASLLSLPRVAVIGLGVIALVQGVRSLRTRRRTEIVAAEPPDIEEREETDWPGDGFDEQVSALRRKRGRSWAGGEHERIRSRLRDAAVEAAAHRWRLSATEAESRIESGHWTDDPAAAWFLGGVEVDRPPWSVRLRAFVGADTPFAFYANRTAEAVVSLREAA